VNIIVVMSDTLRYDHLGCNGNRWIRTPLPEDETILAELMTEAGYTTMLIADTPHLMRDGHRFDRGFTAWEWIRGEEGDRSITDDVPVFFESAESKIKTAERIANCHYRWRAAHWKTERDTFVARTMQRASDRLESNHTHENTAVIFMSDHGHTIGDHGRIGKSGSGPDGDWPAELYHLRTDPGQKRTRQWKSW